MERIWRFERLAVTLARTDFSDPALGEGPGVRERGVRLELRLVSASPDGSVYASPSWELAPAVCRIDLLESAPHAADRMHWHPVMTDGEPGERVFDEDMPRDPEGWLRGFLLDAGPALLRTGITLDDVLDADLTALAGHAEEIVAATADSLVALRAPWPDVRHDKRGMAPA